MEISDLKTSRILVTGGSGLVGSALREKLEEIGCQNVFSFRSSAFDLTLKSDMDSLFQEVKPDYVFALAAKVGGILDNQNNPADFFYDNSLICTYTFEACKKFDVKKLINIGAGCGYPLELQEPLKEENLWLGLPQPESVAYSMVKKMMMIQSLAYRDQYSLNSIMLIPSNIYGEHDNFNLNEAHVIPALVRKFYEAKRFGYPSIEVWGDGSAKRDFLHTADLASALVLGALSYNDSMPLNIAYGNQSSIKDVVKALIKVSSFSGEIDWNTSKPAGQKSREFSLERTKKFLPEYGAQIGLEDGLQRTFGWMAKNYDEDVVRL